MKISYSEEGARFPISMVSSAVWSGDIPLERAHNLQEVGSGKQTMKQELERIGYLGKTEANHESMPIGVRRLGCPNSHSWRLICLGSFRVAHR